MCLVEPVTYTGWCRVRRAEFWDSVRFGDFEGLAMSLNLRAIHRNDAQRGFHAGPENDSVIVADSMSPHLHNSGPRQAQYFTEASLRHVIGVEG